MNETTKQNNKTAVDLSLCKKLVADAEITGMTVFLLT